MGDGRDPADKGAGGAEVGLLRCQRDPWAVRGDALRSRSRGEATGLASPLNFLHKVASLHSPVFGLQC